MFTLPPDYNTIFALFQPYFSHRIWAQARLLLIGAILTPGQRTVTAILRILGLSQEIHFQNYHRVLNRAVWSSLELSRILLRVLLATFLPAGPVIIGLDDTIERRRGAHIRAKGIYRDPVRSSQSHFVKASGLRWLCGMVLVDIFWAGCVWALPFLSVLCPSERYYQEQGREHKPLTAWAEWMLLQLRRWLPDRSLVVVADNSFAVLELLALAASLPEPITMIVRFRLDAALYEPAPPPQPGRKGRPRKKGKRLPTLETIAADPHTLWQKVTIPNWYGQRNREVEIVSDTAVWYHSGKPAVPIRWVLIRDPQGEFKTQALLSTQLSLDPRQILIWFVRRWRMEVTYHEVRTHLGVETQRQWSDAAIARTTPILLGLFSLVTLLAHQSTRQQQLPIRQTAWYHKDTPTFSDALALVRRQIWQSQHFSIFTPLGDIQKIPIAEIQPWLDALCYSP
jgi:DDE superfamily endonuclease